MDANDYHRLVEEYRSSPGIEIYRQLHSLGTSSFVFLRNREELIGKLRAHTSTQSLINFGQDNRQGMEDEFREIARLIHNFVASVKSLVDHTRIIARQVLTANGQQTFKENVNSRFTRDEITSFLHDLRNYLLHVSNPPLQKSIQFDAGRIAIELDTTQLLKSFEWRPASKLFLSRHPESVELETIVIEYADKVSRFNSWLIHHTELDRKSDVDSFWQKQSELIDWCRSRGIPTNDEEMGAFMERDRHHDKPVSSAE